jgi:hypothetical protein
MGDLSSFTVLAAISPLFHFALSISAIVSANRLSGISFQSPTRQLLVGLKLTVFVFSVGPVFSEFS